jgi:hypothetical protein
LKVFDASFPQRKLGLVSASHWLQLYAWRYNQTLKIRRFPALS